MTRKWRSRAACLDEDPELFFPISYSTDIGLLQIEQARAVCYRCPVLAECLQDALAIEQGLSAKNRYGIRAGWTPGERHRGRRIRDRRQKQNSRHGLAA